MTPWNEFNETEIEKIPECMGVFQLARGPGKVAYVGRSDESLSKALRKFLSEGYTHFQWVRLPWPKEAFEMQCRLYHHEGGKQKLENTEHPQPSTLHNTQCVISCQPVAQCKE